MSGPIHLVGQITIARGAPQNADLVVYNPEDILVYVSDALNRVYERIESGKAFYAETPSGSEAITIENPTSSGVKIVIYAISNPSGSTGNIEYGLDSAASGGGSVTEINLLTAAADSNASITHDTAIATPSTKIGEVEATTSQDAVQLASPVAISEGDFFQASHDAGGGRVGVYFYEI